MILNVFNTLHVSEVGSMSFPYGLIVKVRLLLLEANTSNLEKIAFVVIFVSNLGLGIKFQESSSFSCRT